MIVSHKHRFIFLHSRKTAGTSATVALSRILGPDDILTELSPASLELIRAEGGVEPQNWEIPWQRWRPRDWARRLIKRKTPRFTPHMTAATVRRLVGREIWDSYTKIAVDRNPWDLAVSAYFWLHHYEHFEGPFPWFVSTRLTEFQNWRIYTIRNQVAVDHLLRYDHLDAEWPKLCAELGLGDLPLSEANTIQRFDRRSYQEWYDDETRDRVEGMFWREIGLFGWEF